MQTLLQDLRFGLRMLRKNPGFSTVAILTLALAIGANTAIFSVVDAVLIQPLPYEEPEQLVMVRESIPDGRPNGGNSGGAFKDWRDRGSKFTRLAVYEEALRNLTGNGPPERATGLLVSPEYLSVLRVVPALGRDFAASEGAVGGENRVMLLTHSFWRSRFGGDGRVVGKTVSLDQVPHTIIGVLPPRALLRDDVRFLAPEVVDAPGVNWSRSGHWRQVIGRLRPGVAPAEAQAELRGIKEQLKSQYPSWKEQWSVVVTPFRETVTGETRPRLILLLGTVVLVLLIACANVSNLLLARANVRSREMAIRSALGAHSSRIFRQMLTESVLLAMMGCVVGLLVASLGIRVLARLVADQIPLALAPELNLRVLLFTILAACGCGVLFGILPAWRAGRTSVNEALKGNERGAVSRSKSRSQTLFIVSEFAFTLLLLIAAGLFLRSFARLLETKPGFDPRHTLAFDLSLPKAKYPSEQERSHFLREVVDRLRVVPGVTSVGSICSLPLSGDDWGEGVFRIDKPTPTVQTTPGISTVDEGFLPTAGIALLRGRPFTEADNLPNAAPVMVIDTGLAREYFPGEDPLGQRLKLLGKVCEVVGIVSPIRHDNLEHDPRPRVYVPQAQFPRYFSDPRYCVLLRSKLPPLSLSGTLRQTVLEADPDQPLANVRTWEQQLSRSLAPRRLSLALLGLFAAAAVTLAGIGLYGVVSYTVGQRMRELGIRSALGARRSDLLRLVFRGGMGPSLTGMALGLVAALALARLLESQLFEVKAHDPLVFTASIGLLCFMAALAIFFPARRAGRVNPVEALRCE